MIKIKSTNVRNLRNKTHPGKNLNIVRGILRSQGVFALVVGDEATATTDTGTFVS